MEFEYDPAKSASNKDKHGIDFEEAKALWKDENGSILDLGSRDEPRFILVGIIGGKMWTAICTARGVSTRIISVRRSRKSEVSHYENNIGSRT